MALHVLRLWAPNEDQNGGGCKMDVLACLGASAGGDGDTGHFAAGSLCIICCFGA